VPASVELEEEMTRDDLLERLQPAIDELVDRVAAMLPDLVRAELVATLGKLTTEQKTPVKVRVHREPKPAKASGRKPNSCSKCGATGFTAATCGKTHNVGEKVPASPPPRTVTRIASPRSKPLREIDEVSSDGDVALHKVVSFGF
jgi:hypothetical protein